MHLGFRSIPFAYRFVFPAPLILLAPILLPGNAMFWGLPMLQFVPWWTQAWRTLLLGQMPLWNPLVGLGAPLLANYQTALLYPPSWALLPFAAIWDAPGIAYGLGWLTAVHLIWAGIGMLRLTNALGWRELPQTISALAFMLSGYLAARTHFPSIIFAVVWLPWLLWAALRYARSLARKDLLLLTFFTALQLLAGHAQTTWYSIQLTAAWLALWAIFTHGWRAWARGWWGYLIAGVGGFAMAAAQLLPTGEYLRLSQRAVELDPEIALVNSFWPARLLGLFMPGLFGSPATGDFWGYATYWEDALYLGIPAILLALFALFRRGKSREERALAWFAVVVCMAAFLMAWGKDSPVFMLLYQRVPTFGMFKSPSRYMLWLEIMLALLAGLGAQYWRKPTGRGLYWSNLGAAGVFAVALGAGLFAIWLQAGGLQGEDFHGSLVIAPAVFGATTLGFMLLHLRAPDTPGLGGIGWRSLVAGLLLVDLLLAGWGLNPPGGASFYAGQSANAQVVGEMVDVGRLYMSEMDVSELTYRRFLTFEDFQINEEWVNARAAMLPNLFMLDRLASLNNFDPLLPDSYSHLIAAVERGDVDLAAVGVAAIVKQNPEGLYGSVNIEPVAGGTARVYWLNESTGLTARWLEDSPNRLVLDVSTSTVNTLIVADQYYPGWRARLDGDVIEITPYLDDALRAVEIPAGQHRLMMVYQPLSFYAGLGISLAAWSVWLLLWRRERAR
jgi:hypothetical protein